MTHRISSAAPAFANQPDLTAIPGSTAISTAAHELARHFQNQQTSTSARRPKTREALQSRYIDFVGNVNISMGQADNLRERMKFAPNDIELITPLEELKLIIQSLLTELPAMPREKIKSESGRDIYELLTTNLHDFLVSEIYLKARKILPDIALHSAYMANSNIDIQVLMKHIKAEQRLEELRIPTKELIEITQQTYQLTPRIQTLKLEGIITNAYSRIHDIQRALKNYFYFDSAAHQCDKFFVSQSHLIQGVLKKVEECCTQTVEIKTKSLATVMLQGGKLLDVENENKNQVGEDHLSFVKALPKIEGLGELGISTLAHLIESSMENQHPLHAEQRLLQQFNDLCYFTEKYSWAVRELCVKQGLQDLLATTFEETFALEVSDQFKLNTDSDALKTVDTRTQSMDNSTLDSTINPTDHSTVELSQEARLELTTKRIAGLLEKCNQILTSNPMAVLESIQRNPGFYSLTTVTQIYRVFKTEASKICSNANSVKSRIARELQHGQLNPELQVQLENHSKGLSEFVKSIEQEMQYATTDDFKFSVLKQHKTPRAESWNTLIENSQLESISLKPKLPSEDREDHLYEFELAPKPDTSDNKFPSVWLHVHLHKNVHKPAQWQSLEQADVKAAHLKPDHARNLGAKWQEKQRALGNYNTVVERSKVNIDFIKLVASKVEATADQSTNQKKSKGRRR